MRFEKALFQKSYLYFAGFFLFMLLGFWLTYFTRLFEQENYRMHLHGIALVFWCLMLILQPYLIRTKRYPLHRAIGKFSYVWVPVLVVTTLDLFIFRMKASGGMNNLSYSFTALVVNALVAFLVFYGLAVYYRKKPLVHARYMLCTAFPMFTPITDRIIYLFIPSLAKAKWLPAIDSEPIVPVVGFLLADLMLVGLIIWDWRSHRRMNIFPFALAVLLVYHFSVLYFYRYEWWQQFSRWLVGL